MCTRRVWALTQLASIRNIPQVCQNRQPYARCFMRNLTKAPAGAARTSGKPVVCGRSAPTES